MRRAEQRTAHRKPELSQHFLRTDAVARRIVRELRAPAGTTVLEVGAGDGTLTCALAETGRTVAAIEKDHRLFQALQERMAPHHNVECIHGDFLAMTLPAAPYAVVSNVPYGITAAVLRKLLHAARPPDEALLVLQREAARKFSGVPRETLFSLLWKPYFDVEVICRLRRSDFVPAPRVASVVLRITRRPVPLVKPYEAPRYDGFVRTAFAYGAPGVSAALRCYLTSRQVRRLARDLGIKPDARASALRFEQWLAIFRFVEHECLGHDPTLITAA